MSSVSNIGNINSASHNNDIIQFRIGSVVFPRVLSSFTYELKPVYTNVNTTQSGVTSQDFVRNQLVISGLNFDYVTVEEYKELLTAMRLQRGQGGGAFNLTYYDFATGAYDTRAFIVKSCPATIVTLTGTGNPDTGVISPSRARIKLSNLSFQEV